MQTNLYAFTEATPTDGYPGYVSLNKQPDGAVTLTVRSPGDGGRQIGSLTLPAAALAGLAVALSVYDPAWSLPAGVNRGG